MVAYLKAGLQVRTYSDYLRAAWEAKKEDSIELPWGPRTQMTNNLPKPRTTSFFPLRKLKGNQPIVKKPAVCLVQLEEEDAGDDEDQESDDPNWIKGVMEEFMVCLARAVKDAQAHEKCCYHCSSPEHFICNCLLIKTSKEKNQLNGKEGIMPKYISDHSLQMGPITNLLGAKVTCVGLGNAYTRPLGYVVIWFR